MTRDHSERDIHMALDGELPAEERAGFDLWLAAHPDMHARNVRFDADTVRLREALAPVLDEPLPVRLSRMLDAGIVPPRAKPWRWRTLGAAAALLLALGGLAGYGFGGGFGPGPSPSDLFADGAIAAHDMYAAEKLHVVEVGADQKDHLVGWLSKRVGVPLVAPDLSTEGFGLVGGRLLPASGRRSAAQFMYQDPTGNRISLYVVSGAEHADSGFRQVTENGTEAVYWLDDGYACAVAGRAPEKVLMAVANAVYRQLLAGQAAKSG